VCLLLGHGEAAAAEGAGPVRDRVDHQGQAGGHAERLGGLVRRGGWGMGETYGADAGLWVVSWVFCGRRVGSAYSSGDAVDTGGEGEDCGVLHCCVGMRMSEMLKAEELESEVVIEIGVMVVDVFIAVVNCSI
jgi:hypothetical protein